jgi:hypothetical protein
VTNTSLSSRNLWISTIKISDCDHRLDQQFSSIAPRFDVESESPAAPQVPHQERLQIQEPPLLQCARALSTFCSWLGLAPHNDISGGRVLRSRVRKVHNRAGQALRQAAQSFSRSHSVFGAFYRARSARSSAEEAVVATAHKLARVLYHMLTCREAFTPESIRDFD